MKLKATKGYFYGLNNEPAMTAFNTMLVGGEEPFTSKEEALADAESERKKGHFFDDNATVQVYYFDLTFKEM